MFEMNQRLRNIGQTANEQKATSVHSVPLSYLNGTRMARQLESESYSPAVVQNSIEIAITGSVR
jgi:hypothetical protein